jgi:cytosine/adenosine deaminase-related metal-dependent hydrolase
MATMGGVEAVGGKDVIGSITPGKRADIIITGCDSAGLEPVRDPVAALVLYPNGSDVDRVFIDGKLVKSKQKAGWHGLASGERHLEEFCKRYYGALEEGTESRYREMSFGYDEGLYLYRRHESCSIRC